MEHCLSIVLSTQNLIFSIHNSLEGPFTLLAPTDEAFSRIPRETLKKVLENADILKPIIQRHIIPKKALHVKGISWDVHDTLGGQMVSFKSNSVIQIINRIFIVRWMDIKRSTYHYTMLQKLSKCEVKAWLCLYLIILQPLWFCVNSYGPKLSILAILEVLSFDFGKFEQFSSPNFTKIQSSESLKLSKMTFLDHLNSQKFDFTQKQSGGKIVKFQQSPALTSHFESFWSIVH